MNRSFVRFTSLLLFGSAAFVTLAGCGGPTTAPRAAPSGGPNVVEAAAPPNALELTFTYGSEKEKWIKTVTDAFNAAQHKTASGKPIFVRAIPMGSGECIEDLITERRKAHLTSPASAAFIELGNAESRAKTGKNLVGSTENLVLSPVVIAMWKPMAEALGWGKQPIGWGDILALARNPQGWGAQGHAEWGQFRFGHTHPEFSNSGLISLIAEAYAGAGKAKGLTTSDIGDPKVAEFIGAIERSVVHYGSSTGFFGTKMFANGPQYLSAAVLYENMVIESYGAAQPTTFPVVAVYPKEGTFWSDHPVGVVDRPWVSQEHRDAAKIYIKHLLERPQQEKAMEFGFRPGDVQLALTAPLDTAHGVDPKEPKTTLEVPSADVMNSLIQLWRQHKKHSNIVLVFDTSGSMNKENRMTNARIGAVQFLKMLGDDDEVSLLPFDSALRWSARNIPMKTGRDEMTRRIEGLFANGGTALYDAIDGAYQHLLAHRQPDRISAIVVLTDGEDTDSRIKLPALLDRIRFDHETKTLRVFTIKYGSEASGKVLKDIADATQARFFEGKPENIREVFKEIATFF